MFRANEKLSKSAKPYATERILKHDLSYTHKCMNIHTRIILMCRKCLTRSYISDKTYVHRDNINIYTRILTPLLNKYVTNFNFNWTYVSENVPYNWIRTLWMFNHSCPLFVSKRIGLNMFIPYKCIKCYKRNISCNSIVHWCLYKALIWKPIPYLYVNN